MKLAETSLFLPGQCNWIVSSFFTAFPDCWIPFSPDFSRLIVHFAGLLPKTAKNELSPTGKGLKFPDQAETLYKCVVQQSTVN